MMLIIIILILMIFLIIINQKFKNFIISQFFIHNQVKIIQIINNKLINLYKIMKINSFNYLL
jgi:hypothetical protein